MRRASYLLLAPLTCAILACGFAGLGEPTPTEQPPVPAAPPAPAEAPATSAPPVPAAPLDLSHTIVFDGQTYALANRETAATGALNEYVPTGDTLEHWSHLIAVRSYPDQDDPMAAAQLVAGNLQRQTPPRPHQIYRSTTEDRVILDFTTWEGPVTEFNVFIYEREPGAQGLRVSQFALRVYGRSASLAFMRQRLPQERPRLVQLVTEYDFPALLE